MRKHLMGFSRLFIGYFVCAIGLTMTINANIGLAPWDVLNHGIGNLINLPIGRASIVVGLMIVVVDILMGQNIGWGTIFNMIFIGIFVDFLMINSIIPVFNSFIFSFIMMLIGLLVLGYGCFLYIGAGYGAGPRDGLMVALTKKTNKSVRFIKNSLEICALIVGFFLGGKIGIGTAVMSIAGGYFLQFAFKTMNFNVKEVNHRYIIDDINYLKSKLLKDKYKSK